MVPAVKRGGGTVSYRVWMALLLALILTAVSCSSDQPKRQPLVVFAAASLGDVLPALVSEYARSHPDIDIQINLAGSNVLARQIAAGGGADVFISANSPWMDFLAEQQRLQPGSRSALLTNQLMLVQSSHSDFELSNFSTLPMLDFRFLAVGQPESVPAGVYAREFLSGIAVGTSNVWEAIAPRLAPTADVRRALAMVKTDPGIIAMVYATDVRNDPDVTTLLAVPEDEVSITYELALVSTQQPTEDAITFSRFLQSSAAARIFAHAGFNPAR